MPLLSNRSAIHVALAAIEHVGHVLVPLPVRAHQLLHPQVVVPALHVLEFIDADHQPQLLRLRHALGHVQDVARVLAGFPPIETERHLALQLRADGDLGHDGLEEGLGVAHLLLPPVARGFQHRLGQVLQELLEGAAGEHVQDGHPGVLALGPQFERRLLHQRALTPAPRADQDGVDAACHVALQPCQLLAAVVERPTAHRAAEVEGGGEVFHGVAVRGRKVLYLGVLYHGV
jgi:hypothetical protein